MKLLRRADESFDFELTRECKTCAHVFQGRYCNRCGERVVLEDEKSFRYFISTLISALTFFDNRFFKTIRLMFVRPGFVSNEVMRGVRMAYVKPVTMFFFANFLYFLFPWNVIFNSPLLHHMHFLPHYEVATIMVEKRIAEEGTTLEKFTLRFEQQSYNMAKLFLIVFVVMMAVPVSLIYFSKERYFLEHLTLSLEFNSVMNIFLNALGWLIVLLEGLFNARGASLNHPYFDLYLTLILFAATVYLLSKIGMEFYDKPKKKALLNALLLVPCLFVALQLYRGILFFITFWTL